MEDLKARFNLSSEEINYRQQQVEKCFKSHYVGSTFFDTGIPEIIEGLNPFSREYVRATKDAKFDTEVSTKKAGFWEWIKAKFNPSNWR
jgi:hypothetical protein